MPVSKTDIQDMKRMAINAHPEDKACIDRVLKGIALYENQIRDLKAEIEALKRAK